MIVYNITTQVNHAIHKAWLVWQLNTHIPAIMATGCFENYQMLQLLEIDESEGPTYATQFYAVSKADYNRYIALYAPSLRQKTIQAWGEEVVSFRTLMQVVH